MTAENEFVIEKALERKYKVKLTFIPLIEQFAATAITELMKLYLSQKAESEFFDL